MRYGIELSVRWRRVTEGRRDRVRWADRDAEAGHLVVNRLAKRVLAKAIVAV
jgi:hypothetical protein